MQSSLASQRTTTIRTTKSSYSLIPKTIARHLANIAIKQKKENNFVSVDDIINKHSQFSDSRRLHSLTSGEERQFLADVAAVHDRNNNGMSRKEMISYIQSFAGIKDPKRAENHLDYLIRQKKLPGLKNGGRVTAAQKTTTKRMQITISQQLWWHSTIETAWDILSHPNQPSELYLPLC